MTSRVSAPVPFVRFDTQGKDLVTPAARKAARLYPGVVGEVLSTEILSLTQFSWLGESSRAARLMRAVVELEEPAVLKAGGL